MKQIMNSLLVLSIVLFSQCASKKQVSPDESVDIAAVTGKKWQVIELAGKQISGTINGKMPFLQFLEEEARYTATGGCNTMNGEFKFGRNNQITFTRGISTMMACDDMESDQALASVFQNSTNYRLEGEILVLSKGKNGKALAKFKEVPNETSLSGTWELDYIAGSEKPFNELFPNKKPTLVFDLSNNKVTGNSGCNQLNGQVELQGRRIKFNTLATTRMACPTDGEPLFLQTLEKVNIHSEYENTLTLIIGDIAVMRFKKV
ncbi:META domain-containing protein [Sphingobacterium sp. HJSM2_6]|uniref:META domain-containing protein n=1 Tax=Sphingobacterium sp. HJSM2_6 TaxID=3366264 RepID=UPI003BC367DA